MTDKGKRAAIWIQVAIMVASLAVFLGAMSLVGGGFSDRGARFWVTVISIIFANLVFFNVPIWLVASDARSKSSFPFQFTAITFSTLYAVGVGLMALLVVFTQVSSGWLIVGHMVLLLLLVTSLGVYSLANRAVEQMDAQDKQDKAGATNLNLHVKSIRDRVALCQQDGLDEARAAIGELVDSMHYATGESLPGSESVDAEITGHFKDIEMALMDLDDAEDAEAVAGLTKKIIRDVKASKLAIQRREDLMKTLR